MFPSSSLLGPDPTSDLLGFIVYLRDTLISDKPNFVCWQINPLLIFVMRRQLKSRPVFSVYTNKQLPV